MIKHAIARREAWPGRIFLGRIVDEKQTICGCPDEATDFCGSWCPHFTVSMSAVRIGCRSTVVYHQLDAEPFTVAKV
jgi:hypothetical protein